MSKIDLDAYQERIDKKLISKQKHPDAELYIYNYTHRCQYEQAWDEYTIEARGIITDAEGNVKYRPFKKFFNFEQHGADTPHGELPLNESMVVSEKLDGSLGIAYCIDNKWAIATRGSFTSKQALHATERLQKYLSMIGSVGRYNWFDKDITYLFEIIYPDNRIVVDYGDKDELVQIARILTDTGEELPTHNHFHPWPIAKQYHFNSIDTIKKQNIDNAEGFVVKFMPSGVRTKIKFAEYMRLHRIMTGVSSRTVWEWLKNGDEISSVIENVPDEFYKWIMNKISELNSQYRVIKAHAFTDYEMLPDTNIRSEIAKVISTTKYPGLVWSLYDKKLDRLDESIWKLIKPPYEQPFMVDEEG